MEMFVDDRNATVPEVPSLLRAQQSQHWQRRRPWGRRGSDDCPGPSVAAVAAGADLTLAQAQQQAVTAQKKPGSGSLLRVCRVHFFQKGVLKMVGTAYALQKLVHFPSLHEPSPTQFQIFKTWQAQEGLFDIEIINNCTP